jgi:hypothetical protein
VTGKLAKGIRSYLSFFTKSESVQKTGGDGDETLDFPFQQPKFRSLSKSRTITRYGFDDLGTFTLNALLSYLFSNRDSF